MALKEHGLNVSLSTVATIAALVPMFWFIAKPILISQISTAMADEFENTIDEKQEPVQNAFKVLLLSEITKLRKEIAKLRTHEGDDDWTEDDAEYLAELTIELEALRDAYNEL
jgi:uncharacterized protein YlxW (UPF0749 family)